MKGNIKMSNRKIKKLYELLVKAGIPCEIIGNALLVNSECRRVLKLLPPNFIDSCVTDGPYGINHMGKDWDNFDPKAIAKGTRRKGGAGISPSMFSGKYDKTRSGAVRFQQFSYEWAKEVFRVLKFGSHLVSFCSPKRYHRMTTAIEDCHFEIRDLICWLSASNHPYSHDISKAIDELAGAEREIVGPNPSRRGRRNWDDKPKNLSLPATAQARYWDGWGTRLRQTSEPILLARKPIAEKSIARNVLSYGTSGINIDACRIGKEGGVKCIVRSKDNKDKRIYGGGISTDVEIVPINKGRFPTNTIISEEVADILGDKAKFFYCPKVSKKERNAGC
jgi:site-specific DNA-methyltransferase (adenine-specific)